MARIGEDDDDIVRAEDRIMDWVMPRLSHSSMAEAARLRAVIRNAVRVEILGLDPEPWPQFIGMIKESKGPHC